MKKNNMMKSAVLMMLAAMTINSCSTSKNVNKEIKDENQVARPDNDMDMDEEYLTLSDAQLDILQKNNKFAFNLFQKVSGMDSKVVSPMSVSYLMGMLANGADGETQQEIMKAIGCDRVSVKELNELYKLLIMSAGKLDKQTTVNIANYVAVNKKYQLDEDFVKAVSDNYQAGIESLDFNSQKSADRINSWCEKQTKGMIPKFIDRMEPSAVSYLLNAIYFKGTWMNEFDKKNTKLENFRGYTRDIQKVEMMHQNEKFDYYENETFKAVQLLYGNGTYCMTVMLPNEGKSIDDMMKGMDAEKFMTMMGNVEECKVDLKLPKFITEMELPLNDIISQLGAPSIFNPSKADFSRFAKGDFFVSQMLQKAKIEVSEKGTEAAAVTGAIMVASLGPREERSVVFHADRPFVYTITDQQTGAILFMGQFTGK